MMTRGEGAPWWSGYLLAVVATAAVGVVRYALSGVLGETAPIIPFVVPVILAAWYGGLRPGLLATALCTLVCNYLFVPPHFSLVIMSVAEGVALGTFVLCGVTISWLCEALHAARRRAEAEAGRARREADERGEAEERLRVTLLSIGDGLITTDASGRVVALNPVAESLTGWASTEAAGQPLEEVFRIVNEDSRQPVENPAMRALKEGAIVGLANHTVLVARDGTERPIDDSAAPIRGKEGEVVGCVLVFRDISERQAAEAGVRAERERFRLAADAVKGIIYEFDFATGHVERTRGLYEVLGYRPDEVPPTAEWWMEQVHPDDRERLLHLDPAAISRDATMSSYRVRHKDGRWLHVEDRAVLVKGDGGKPVRMVGCTVDMTDHKRAELELREKEEQLRLAVRAADMIVFRWDIATDIVTRLGETPTDAPLGPQYTFSQAMETIHPDDLPAVRRRVDAALRGDGPESYVSEHRHNETPNRSWRWILVHGRVRRDEQGRPLAMLGLGIDITATKQAEADNRRRETFITGVLGSITDGFYVVGGDWRLTFANDEIVARTGRRRDEIVGGNIWEMFPLAVGQKTYVELHRAMADRVAVEYEALYEPSQRWFSDKVYPTDDGGLAVYSRDITDRKGAEEELRRRAEEVQVLFDTLPIALFVAHDPEGRTITGNRAAQELLRTPARNLSLTAPVEELPTKFRVTSNGVELPPDQLPVQRAARGERVRDEELEIVFDDGRVVYEVISASPLYDTGGRVRGAVAGALDISTRKHAEQRLRESGERLRLALDSANMGGWDWNVLSGEIVWTARTRELFGVDANVPITFDVFVSCLHPDDVGPNQRKTDEASATGEYENEYRVVLPGGGVRWLATRGRMLRDGQHRPTRMLGVVMDMTARRRAEEELKERTAQLNFALASTGVGMWLNTLPLGRLNWDDRAKELFFVPPGVEPTVELFWSRLHPDDREPTRLAVEAAIRDRTLYAIDHRVVNPDTGEVRWVRSSGQATYDTAGMPTRFDGINYDITVEKRQEKELEDGQRTLATLVERCPFGIYLVDADFRIASMNTRSQAGAFANVRPVIGRPFDEAMRILWPEAVAAAVISHFRHTLDTGESYRSRDFVNPRADNGQIEGYEWELHRLTLPDGRNGVVCYYYDSTKLRHAEQQLREADRRKDEFLATLAHELRNPLAPIRNGLQVMRLAKGNAEAIEQSRTMMERQLDQMVRLVDDLMDVSRISRGRVELKKERVQLTAVVNNAVETSRPLIEQMGHELTVTLPEQPVVVDADLTRLAQVFMNLLNNAAKYSEIGGRIWLTVERQGSDVVVSVKDTGIGIAADQLPRIFEMFSQVDRSLEKAQGGLGIGLTLVKRLVEMHDGRIEARSDGPGEGSEFIVRLPVVVEASVPQTARRDEQQALAKSSLRILIVDDNRDGADSLSMMLKVMGNETRTAYDGEEAVQAAGEYRPDVILLDIGLPKLNGYEACRRIREQAGGKEMVIIAQTGWGQDEDRQRTHDAGFDHHLVKPVDPQALMRLLAGLSEAARK